MYLGAVAYPSGSGVGHAAWVISDGTHRLGYASRLGLALAAFRHPPFSRPPANSGKGRASGSGQAAAAAANSMHNRHSSATTAADPRFLALEFEPGTLSGLSALVLGPGCLQHPPGQAAKAGAARAAGAAGEVGAVTAVGAAPATCWPWGSSSLSGPSVPLPLSSTLVSRGQSFPPDVPPGHRPPSLAHGGATAAPPRPDLNIAGICKEVLATLKSGGNVLIAVSSTGVMFVYPLSVGSAPCPLQRTQSFSLNRKCLASA